MHSQDNDDTETNASEKENLDSQEVRPKRRRKIPGYLKDFVCQHQYVRGSEVYQSKLKNGLELFHKFRPKTLVAFIVVISFTSTPMSRTTFSVEREDVGLW